jgi:hypothetical protein
MSVDERSYEHEERWTKKVTAYAIPNTVGELLGELFRGCDIAAELTRVLTFVEAFANQMQAGLEWVGEVVERLENGPAVAGYEAMLVERGHQLTAARIASSC